MADRQHEVGLGVRVGIEQPEILGIARLDPGQGLRRQGLGDLGANAARIREFLARLRAASADYRLVACIRGIVSGFRGAAPGWQGATREHTGSIRPRTPAAGMPRQEGTFPSTETGHELAVAGGVVAQSGIVWLSNVGGSSYGHRRGTARDTRLSEL